MDPSEVHPFDNAAHKALTEVIPWQLAKIDAGINRTEQEYFNYKNNKWEKVSSIRKRLDRTREEVLDSIRKVIRDCVPEMVTEELNEDTVINTETAIDSMGFILVICKLEALFNVRIPERQWQKLSTMGDVADAIIKRLPKE